MSNPRTKENQNKPPNAQKENFGRKKPHKIYTKVIVGWWDIDGFFCLYSFLFEGGIFLNVSIEYDIFPVGIKIF